MQGQGVAWQAQKLAGGAPLDKLLAGGWAPHGYFRRTMFEACLAHRLPVGRALWFARLVYFSRNRCLPTSKRADYLSRRPFASDASCMTASLLGAVPKYVNHVQTLPPAPAPASRSDAEARAREWTQHLTDFMGSVLAEPGARPPLNPAADAAAAGRGGAGPGGGIAGAAGDAAGWLHIDLVPLLGRYGLSRPAAGRLKLQKALHLACQ